MFNHSSEDKGPGVRVPPPLIFAVFILIALGLDTAYPSTRLDIYSLRLIGWILCIGSSVIAGVTVVQFLQAKTNIEPWKPDDSLIVSGLYQYSRNPIYLAFVLLSVGLGLALDNIWIVCSIVPSVLLLHRLVIEKEEKYLSARFGQEYADYCQKVRRWI